MRWLAFILLISVLLVACVPLDEQVICTSPYIEHDGACCIDVNENGSCDDQEEPEAFEKVEEKIIEPTPEPVEAPAEEPAAPAEAPAETPAETPAEPKRELPKTKLEELMEAYAQGVTSYSYRFNGNKWLIRGDKSRVKLADVLKLSSVQLNGKHYQLFYIDNVYLEAPNRKATGYCEGTHQEYGRQCASLEIRDIPYELSYADYQDKKPADWLFDYYLKEPLRIETTAYYVKGRQTTLIIWDDEGTEVKMYFDNKIGLPLKVELTQGTATDLYSYDDLTANTVRDADVRHRNIGEIGSEEAFQSNLP